MLWCATLLVAAATTQARNILMLVVDDMRIPESFAQTPNIDALMASSMRYTQAVVSIPVCGASRASTLTGRSPDALKAYNYTSMPRDQPHMKDVPTLPGYMHQAGFWTAAYGKVWHGSDATGTDASTYAEFDDFKHASSFTSKYKGTDDDGDGVEDCPTDAVVRMCVAPLAATKFAPPILAAQP